MENIYDEKGNIIEGTFVKYYSEGKIMSETPYRNGKINGEVVEYHYNGNVSSITPYVDGVVHGLEKIYC